jgi:uncharacterized protein (DUF885 family)
MKPSHQLTVLPAMAARSHMPGLSRLRAWLLLAVATTRMLGCAAESEPARDASAEVEALANEAWQHLLHQSPYLQNRQGMLVTEIPDLSESRAAADVAFARSLLQRIVAIPADELSHDDVMTLESLRWDNEIAVAGEPFYWLRFPITPYVGGQALNSAHQVLADHPFEGPEHAGNYLNLLEEYADMMDQWTAHTRGQGERGIYISKHALPAIAGLFQAMESGVARDALTVVPERLEALPDDQRQAFAAAVEESIRERVEPAYDALHALLTSQGYQSRAPEAVGLAQYADGESYYRFLVRANTTMDITPEALHELGMRRVAELEAEMATIRREVGFEGTREQFHDMLRTDPRFLARTPDDVEARYMGYIARIEPLVPEYFSTQPQAGYGVKRLDLEQEASMTFGFYQQPTPAEPVGYYRYNGSKLEDRSLVWAGPLIYHELIPGHHFHIASQNENRSLPIYRRENISYGAYNEGWGNYAAKLAGEMGLLDDPYDRYGWALFDMFISVRLVVDTGMNLMDWSLEEGRQYMREHMFQSETEIATESIRYSTDLNGQALCYKAGLERLLEIRAWARKLAGESFDIRDFHDAVLGSGALPMKVLQEHIEWSFDPERVRISRGSSSDGSRQALD